MFMLQINYVYLHFISCIFFHISLRINLNILSSNNQNSMIINIAFPLNPSLGIHPKCKLLFPSNFPNLIKIPILKHKKSN